jgi:predicted MFS family arabinose efflux permease
MSTLPPAKEKSLIAALSSLYALRMLGLFLVYPVLAIYAHDLPGATPFLIGLAMGGYGLTQAILQIPFGILSDHFGRKRLIIIGLLLFALGSVVAALSDSIYGLIAGRLLQGTGAISAVVTALLADLLPAQKRSKAMAIVGLTIGMTFGLSLVLAPALSALYGLGGLFWIIAILSILALGVLILFVPNPEQGRQALPMRELQQVFANRQLWYLNISIFCLHAVLTGLFVWLPPQLQKITAHWYQQSAVYLGLLIASYAFMMPILIRAEKMYRQKWIVQASQLGLCLVFIYFAFMPHSLWYLLLGLLLFLIPFNLLEAILPAWVSRVAPVQAKGAALGMYATAQFLGIFVGGVATGLLLNTFSLSIVFFSSAILMLIWFILVRGLKPLSPHMEQ